MAHAEGRRLTPAIRPRLTQSGTHRRAFPYFILMREFSWRLAEFAIALLLALALRIVVGEQGKDS
ncbi:MAG TPA: hypothetical protein VEL76_18270 [Gemmataceae bacterium]|nr:hypothetical protein [Gemmataceae bacterium]